MDICELLYDKEFLKDKTVKVGTLQGEQCVEIIDKDKTFRYLSNTIDMERLNKLLKDLEEQKTAHSFGVPNTDKIKNILTKQPMSFEEAMYDKDMSTKTDEDKQSKTVYVGGTENMGDSVIIYLSKVASFFNTHLGVSNIDCKYITPKDKKHLTSAEYIEAIKAMETADVIVLNSCAVFEKAFCEKYKNLPYVYIPEKV